MARYMLDTNICIYLMKHQPPEVAARFAQCYVGDVVISAISWPSWNTAWLALASNKPVTARRWTIFCRRCRLRLSMGPPQRCMAPCAWPHASASAMRWTS